MPDPTVKLYDPETRKITNIPIRELSDSMIAVRIEGIEGTVYMDRQHLKISEPRHTSLPADLVERIRKVSVAMKEVLPDSLETWVEDFRRDDDPEPEVVIWERIAGKFLLLTNPSDPVPRKKEVAQVLLNCSTNSAVVAQLAASCKHLGSDEIKAICAEWNT
jgi:hypothetical protein